MGSVGDAYDNALCESFFATLECELLVLPLAFRFAGAGVSVTLSHLALAASRAMALRSSAETPLHRAFPPFCRPCAPGPRRPGSSACASSWKLTNFIMRDRSHMWGLTQQERSCNPDVAMGPANSNSGVRRSVRLVPLARLAQAPNADAGPRETRGPPRARIRARPSRFSDSGTSLGRGAGRYFVCLDARRCAGVDRHVLDRPGRVLSPARMTSSGPCGRAINCGSGAWAAARRRAITSGGRSAPSRASV